MTLADALRLAFAGTRADRFRVAATAAGAAIAVLVLLACATVLAVRPESGRYRNRMLDHAVLLDNLALAMLLFAVPVMFFVAQCARLGAPSRSRRLAIFRMAGATSPQVGWIAAVETGVAATFGTALGAVAYFGGRSLLDRPGADGLRALPTDVLPDPAVVATVLIGVPVFATLLTVVLLRRVAVTPFGVVRHTGRQRVRAWPGLLGVVGLAGLLALEPLSRHDFFSHEPLGIDVGILLPLWVLSSTVLLMLGLMLGTAWIGYAGARLLLRLTKRPSALIAARQTLADPYEGSRTHTAILVTTAFGAAAMMLQSWLVVNVAVRDAANHEWVRRHGGTRIDMAGTAAFRADVAELVNGAFLALIAVTALTLLVALVESGIARRRTAAALVASGTPRSVLALALCWRVLIPLVPGTMAAGLAGMFAMRPLTRTASASNSVSGCVGTSEQCADEAFNATHQQVEAFSLTFPVPLPWAEVSGLVAAALLAVLAVVAVGIVLQRATTNPSELRAA